MSEEAPTWEDAEELGRKLSAPQLDALGMCCMGRSEYANRRSLEALERKGLVERGTKTIPGEPGKGALYAAPMILTIYEPVGLWVTHLWAIIASERNPNAENT